MSHSSPSSTESIPASVAWLGYGGVLPFALLAAAGFSSTEYSAICTIALILYSAVILSFVGALHWAFAMTLPGLSESKRSEFFGWSVVPALLAWLAALLIGVSQCASMLNVLHDVAIAAALLIVGFVSTYKQDARLAIVAKLPAWYLPLRLRLTAVACTCIASLAFADLMR